MLRRRRALQLLGAAALTGCAGQLEPLADDGTGEEAASLLRMSAAAHGIAALGAIADISVGYTGRFAPVIDWLQPELVDRDFRGMSQERLLPRAGLVGQAHRGPKGAKQVLRASAPDQGSVRVWFNGVDSHDDIRRAAAALVADYYGLFLLGPMLLANGWRPSRRTLLQRGDTQRISVADHDFLCDTLRVAVFPGFGFASSDRLDLYVDQEQRLMRRVRFTLNGLDSTQGAVAEVDLWSHIPRLGVQWPTRFHERLLRPAPLSVHDWAMIGLDMNRGIDPADISGVAFTGRAAADAGLLT